MTTLGESITNIAALTDKIKRDTHLMEPTIVKIVELVLNKQIADHQMAIQERQLGYQQQLAEQEPEPTVGLALVPNEVIDGTEPPEAPSE